MKVSDITTAYETGRSLFRSFSKNINITTTAGTAQDLSMSPGNPAAQYYVGSIATATPLARSTDGGLDHGPNVGSSYTKFFHNITLQTLTAGAVPMVFEILDYLAFYPFIGMDSGVQALTTGITIPRYSPSEGIQMMLIEQNPYVGAAKVQITYTNSAGVAGQLTPVITLNSITNIGTIATAAPTLLGQSTFIPLAHGDHGVSYPESIEILVGDVGVLCLVLVKPLASVMLYEITTPSDWDLYFHQGMLPQIKDDAYLNLVAKPAGNATGATIYGNLETIWVPN